MARYGEEILPAPKAKGLGLAAYVLPLLAIALAALGFALALRRLTRGGEGGAATAPGEGTPLDPELARIVDEELAR